ncbi:uncharacterized protein LOC129566995 [Sitodiplosis mosellana]|uniref:uncharacterized protein LOC129566995 n=1 Tax=Sitodiplosis mosellana TaxID=263140 RepID=UPI002444C769|nr:uncharacterized protein LOC129566995 [Sitodiplosis mosellana]
MTVFKSGIFLMFVFIEQSTQFSISSEVDSELPLSSSTSSSSTSSSSSNHNQTGCLKTIGQCFRQRPNELVACGLEHAMNNIDCFIASNNTWQFNEFISLKKNADWKPSEIEARHDQTMFESVLSKLSDLIASRSIQFSVPTQNELLAAEGRVKSGFDFDLTKFGGSGIGFGPEGRKKKFKHGMMGMMTVIAMVAQLFLGKIAFLAGAALLFSKISLLFSIVNALKKHNYGGMSGGGNYGGGGYGGGGGGDHIVYGEPGHGGYQRSIIESPMDWVFTDKPSNTVSPIPT